MQRGRCQSSGCTHSRLPEEVAGQQRAVLMRLFVLSVSLEVLGCFVSHIGLWQDVQQLPWNLVAKLPGVVLVAEAWLPLKGRQHPVAVVLDTEGQPYDLRRTGPDFDGTAYCREPEARSVHTLVTDDDPAYRKALQLRAGPAAVRRAHAAHRAPAAAGLLRVGPLGRGPAVTARTVSGGACHGSDGTTLCVAYATPPSPSTNRLGLVWPLQAPGAAGPRPEDAAGHTDLPASAGRKPGLKPGGPPGPGRRSRSCPPEPLSTKVKQCLSDPPTRIALTLTRHRVYAKTGMVSLVYAVNIR